MRGNQDADYYSIPDQTGFYGNISADPMLVGYYLYCGSPAIDAGTDWQVYDDIENNVRPQGAGFDMGAFEGCVIKQIKHPQLPSMLPATQNHISE